MLIEPDGSIFPARHPLSSTVYFTKQSYLRQTQRLGVSCFNIPPERWKPFAARTGS
jgi:hypothetical protein